MKFQFGMVVLVMCSDNIFFVAFNIVIFNMPVLISMCCSHLSARVIHELQLLYYILI